ASFAGSCTGNSATVTNGVYTSGSYANPAWISELSGSKITGRADSARSAAIADTVKKMPGQEWNGTTLSFICDVEFQHKIQYNRILTILDGAATTIDVDDFPAVNISYSSTTNWTLGTGASGQRICIVNTSGVTHNVNGHALNTGLFMDFIRIGTVWYREF
ncbi:MAG: hypothetical protein JW915_24195, partial [Chitinispirillaceae bacterium]|nr:hypothetical protein [Chitinispirillaceae bacterium]